MNTLCDKLASGHAQKIGAKQAHLYFGECDEKSTAYKRHKSREVSGGHRRGRLKKIRSDVNIERRERPAHIVEQEEELKEGPASEERMTITLKTTVETQQKKTEVMFEYHLDRDTPEGIAEEMKNNLSLRADEIEKIRHEIEKILELHFSAGPA